MKPDQSLAFGGLFFQIGIIMMVFALAIYPHYAGTEVTLSVVPVDPRSFFRGNYARLRLPEHTVAIDFKAGEKLCPLDTVYVPLVKDGDIYRGTTGVLDKPKEGIFLKGRTSVRSCNTYSGRQQVTYGLEAYFAPRAEAEQIDRELRNRNSQYVVDIMVTSGGEAAIKRLRKIT